MSIKVDLTVIIEKDIEAAIKIYDNDESICKNREARDYNLIYNDKKYPHKCIVGIAYNIHIGEEGILSADKYQATGNGKSSAEKILENLRFSVKKKDNSVVKKEIENQSLNQTKLPLNQILYGPPGTGKTYNTINKALEIILEEEPDSEIKELLQKDTHTIDERKKLKDKFVDYKDAGQIEFVTFHQSYGYEEFVEGIKANLDSEQIKYKLEEGVFKKLNKKAKDNYIDSKKTSKQIEKEKTLKQKIEFFLNNAIDNDIEFSKTKGGKFRVKEFDENEIMIFAEDSSYSDNALVLQTNELYKILESNIDLNTSRQMAKEVFNINNQRQKDTYYLSMCKKFKEVKFKNIKEIENKEPLKNFILIIDEINRGNISKIFGELITLIEPSKRIGADEEIFLKLPNSPEPFGVPSNLYIIGTMNTADRSIAQIDTALRRRFVFEEMMPKPELLQGVIIDEINVSKILEAINERIEYIYDREHTIGHSYFLPLLKTPTKEKLDEIFRVNIIPLLAEYFYGDWGDIKVILNDFKIKGEEVSNFITLQKDKKFFIKKENISNKIYKVNRDFNSKRYINIYKELQS